MIYCPLISQLSLNEQNIWVEQLNNLLAVSNLTEKVTVVLNQTLTTKQKEQCEVAIVANPNPDDLHEYKGLKWVQSLWAGVDKLVDELSSYSFEIVRLVDPTLSKIMSEAVLSWTLYLHRQMPEYLAQQKAKVWKQLPHVLPQERTISILGLGELGRASAVTLKNHGFNVNGWSQSQKQLEGIQCFYGDNELYDSIKEADIIVCLLPLTTKTRYILNKNSFMDMKTGVSVINFARGGIVNYRDLVESLNTGLVNHAVLDVFEQEPLIESSELWHHPSITLLPHISAPTHMNSAAEIATSNLSAYITNGISPVGINKNKGY
jgi:glyoxylate/hydroxypyruvate reductase A